MSQLEVTGSNTSLIRLGQTYKMKITSVNSATSFGVQLHDWEGTIDFIQESCQKYGPDAPPLQAKDLHEGKLCLARFAVDKNWYRAFIREVHEEMGLATVFFADYGNVDDCDIKNDLKECPISVLKIFPQVIECQLVNGNPSGTGMKNIINKLDDLLEAETYVDGKVVRIVDNQGWLLNQAGGDGPVVVSIPELDGVDSKFMANNANAQSSKQATQVPVVTVAKVQATCGAKPEVGEKKVLMNGTSVDFQEVDEVDGGGSQHVSPSMPVGIDYSSASSMLLAATDELAREISLLKQQILDVEKKNPGPAVRKMTPRESATRIQECKAECVQYDQKINFLLELISAKDLAAKKAEKDFTTDMTQIERAVREKDDELVTLRAQAKLRCT